MSRHFDADDDSVGNDETRFFRRFLSPDGTIESIDEIRRNGVGVPRPTFSSREDEEAPWSLSELLQTYRIVMSSLTSIERRIWVKLLRGNSMKQTAEFFNLTPQALYSRIRGDGKSCRGMIAKNDDVRHWWERRQNKV